MYNVLAIIGCNDLNNAQTFDGLMMLKVRCVCSGLHWAWPIADHVECSAMDQAALFFDIRMNFA